jgi:nucleotide-binding universal stress UspA family protein
LAIERGVIGVVSPLAREAARGARALAGGSRAMAGPILICFDESEGAKAAIEAAADLLRPREAVVLCVGVPAHDEVRFNPAGKVVGRLTSLFKEWDDFMRDLACKQAEAGAALARGAGIDATALSAFGKPWTEIVRVAAEQDAAAIVMGARRRTVAGGVLGSVSARVVVEAGRPVLVIPSAGRPDP